MITAGGLWAGQLFAAQQRSSVVLRGAAAEQHALSSPPDTPRIVQVNQPKLQEATLTHRDMLRQQLWVQASAPAKRRRRLDEICLEQHPEHSRNVVQSWIAQGKVQVNGRVITKAGTPVPATAAVQITAVVPKFVSRSAPRALFTPFSNVVRLSRVQV